MIYYLFLLVLFIFGLLEIFDKGNDKYLLYILSFIFFCIFSGLKYEVGTDYLTYKYYYENSQNVSVMSANGVESGYVFIMRIFKSASFSFVGFWFLLSFINFSLKYFVFHKYSPLIFSTLLLYFVGLFMERDFDGIRQGFAIAICYSSIPFILRRKILPFFLLIIAASTIHASSLIFLPAYYFLSIKFSNKFIYGVTAILVIFVLANVSFSGIIIEMLPDSLIKMRINTYMTFSDGQYSQKIGLSIGLIFRITILYIFTYFSDKIKIEKPIYTFLRNGFFIGLCLSLFFNDFDILAHRLTYIYREFQIFIVPLLIFSCSSKKIRLFLFTLLFIYSLILLNRILNAETLKGYYDYKNYLLQ